MYALGISINRRCWGVLPTKVISRLLCLWWGRISEVDRDNVDTFAPRRDNQLDISTEIRIFCDEIPQNFNFHNEDYRKLCSLENKFHAYLHRKIFFSCQTSQTVPKSCCCRVDIFPTQPSLASNGPKFQPFCNFLTPTWSRAPWNAYFMVSQSEEAVNTSLNVTK